MQLFPYHTLTRHYPLSQSFFFITLYIRKVWQMFDLHRGSYMSALVLLNLLNELRERDEMRGLPKGISLFLQTV